MHNERNERGSTILHIQGLSKAFQSVQALHSVDMDVKAGTIHALIGRNGSGKSTLIKVLSGYHQEDAGTILVGGKPFRSDLRDKGAGLAFVHQDLGIIGKMTVMENLALVHGYATKRGMINWRVEEKKARASLEPFGLENRVHDPMDTLSKGEATVVAIARSVSLLEKFDNAILVLDEPTSYLPRKDITFLFETMNRLVADRFTVLFVTHDLREVLEVADYVTVLRDGKVAVSGSMSQFDHERLVAALAGKSKQGQEERDAALSTRHSPKVSDQTILSLKGIYGQILRGIDLDIAQGEIVGVTGLLGSGIHELAHIASARAPFDSGSASFDGRNEPRWGRAHYLSEQIGFVPENRVTQGILPRLTVRENISIANLPRFTQSMGISRKLEGIDAASWIEKLQVVPPNMDLPLEILSGGNQQKVIMGRWLSVNPKLLVVEGLTQGIDVVSKEEVLRIVRQAAAASMSILLISYEFEEISKACDRLIVIRGGRIAGELRPPSITNEEVVRLIS